MKNILIITLVAIPLALFISGCGEAAQSAEMMKKEMEKINTAVDEKLEILTDSLSTVCIEKVDSIALMRISQNAKRGTSTGTTTSTTGKTTTSTQTKKDKISGQGKVVTESDTKTKKDKIEGKAKEVTKEQTDKKKSKMKGGGN